MEVTQKIRTLSSDLNRSMRFATRSIEDYFPGRDKKNTQMKLYIEREGHFT